MTRQLNVSTAALFTAAALQGPLSVPASAQWTQTAGPPGGSLASLVGDGQQAIFASVDGAILRSTDAGQTFTAPPGAGLAEGLASPALIVGDALFAVVITQPGAADLFISGDDGDTWTPTTLGQQVEGLADAKLIKWNGTVIAYVDTAGNDMLLSSDDLGQTWTTLSSDMGSGFLAEFAVRSDMILMYNLAIARSLDGGATWEPISTNIPFTNLWEVVAASDNVIIAKGLFGHQLVGSITGGDTWVSLFSGALGNTFHPAVTLPDQSLLNTSESGGLYRSIDNGASWLPLAAEGLPAGTLTNLTSLGGGLLMVTGSNGPLVSTDAGESWSFIGDNFIASSVARLNVAKGELFASTSGVSRFFRSADHGATWSEVLLSFGQHMVTDVVPLNGGAVLASTSTQGVFTIAPGAALGMPASTGLPTLASSEQPFEPMNALARLGDAIFVGTGGAIIHVHDGSHCSCSSTASGQGVYRTTNGGATWVQVANGLPINTFDIGGALLHPISHFAVVGDTLLAGTPRNGIYRTTNLGASWSEGTGLPTGASNQLADIAVDADTAYAMTAGGLYRSTNAGQTWMLVNDDVAFGALEVLNGDLYASDSSSLGIVTNVHRSTNGGETWQPVDDEFDGTIVLSLTALEGKLFAGTHGQGVWSFKPGDSSQPADLNGDGSVNAADLALLLGSWGACAGCQADLNGDRNVNAADLALLLGAWSN